MYNFFNWFNLLFGIPQSYKSRALKYESEETIEDAFRKDIKALEQDAEKIWGKRF